MATRLRDLPKYLVLEPLSTVRLEVRLAAPACEFDVELDNPAPGRSFVLLLGPVGGPYVQRVRLAGRARIFFDPQRAGVYELLLANPQREPVVLRMRGRDVGPGPSMRPGTTRAAPHRSGRASGAVARPRRTGARRTRTARGP